MLAPIRFITFIRGRTHLLAVEVSLPILFNPQNIKDCQVVVAAAVTPAAPIEIQLVAAAAEKESYPLFFPLIE